MEWFVADGVALATKALAPFELRAALQGLLRGGFVSPALRNAHLADPGLLAVPYAVGGELQHRA